MKKNKEKFTEYILFNPEAFNLLSAMSYIFAFLFCGAMTLVGIFFELLIVIIIFGIFTLLSIYNIYKHRNVFKVFKRKEEEYLDITVADTLNAISGAKEEEEQ